MLLTMESKTAAASKLEQLILRGRTKAGEVIAHVMNNQPQDRLQTGGNFTFDAEDGNGLQIRYVDPRQGTIRQPMSMTTAMMSASFFQLADRRLRASSEYGRYSGEFGPVERHAVPAQQNGCRTEQEPDGESDPQAWLTDKILDA